MQLVIDRKNWSRGKESKCLMLDEKGKLCVVGFLLRAYGFKDNAILNRRAPGVSPERYIIKHKVPFLFLRKDSITACLDTSDQTKDCNMLMYYNDNFKFTDKQREDKISSILNTHGISVVFKG